MPNELPPSAATDAHALYAAWLADVESGGGEDFERFAARHRDCAAGLHRLHDHWQVLGGLLRGSATRPNDTSDMGAQANERPRGIGDFELVRKLGSGGMGEVWEARQVSLGRSVALKLMRAPSLSGADEVARFRREAQAGGRIRHQGIVAVHAVGEADGRHYIAMELVEGGRTLRALIEERRRAEPPDPGQDARETAELFARIADALAAAHAAGVLHRDIKPQNILLSREGFPKVADFGLAKVSGELSLSHTGDVAGTYAYMSPEQVRAKALDERSDVFSLGATLYECLTGVRAFPGDTSHQIVMNLLEHDPPDARAVRSRVPEELALICSKALEKERDRRYASMVDLADDLRRFLAHEPIHAHPPSRRRRAQKWIRRHPTASSVAALGGGALLLISLLAVRLAIARAEAVANAQAALVEKTRAERAAELASARATQILQLSAREDLRDLVQRSDRLWPSVPDLAGDYAQWLREARALVERLPAFRAELAALESRAVTAQRDETPSRPHPKQGLLEACRARLGWMQLRLRNHEPGGPIPEPAPSELGIDLAALPTDAQAIIELARPLVTPSRRAFGQEPRGLALAREAVSRARAEERVLLYPVLIDALIANGRADEAAAEAERVLQTLPAQQRAELLGWLGGLRTSAEYVRSPGGLERQQRDIAELEETIAALEREIGTEPSSFFARVEDRWWHAQLAELVTELEAFADPSTGPIDGLSVRHLWGVERRLAAARTLRERSIDAHRADWDEAIAAIADRERSPRYGGLQIAPQLGLVPLGPDPQSGLFEFAHVLSGDTPNRAPAGEILLEERSSVVLVLLPGGKAWIGSSQGSGQPNHDPLSDALEQPAHELAFEPFFVSKYELTQAQWVRITGSNPSSYHPGFLPLDGKAFSALHPVERVTREECDRVLTALGLSLPTEAQWEYAARAGTSSPWSTGTERESLIGAANLADASAARTGARWPSIQYWPGYDDGYPAHAPVHTFRPNPFGLHHVHGNLWEWCSDGGAYDQPARAGDGLRLKTTWGACRGGSYVQGANWARSAFRNLRGSEDREDNLGVRPARQLDH